MTDAIVNALEELGTSSNRVGAGDVEAGKGIQGTAREPLLSDPAIGKPISHGQVIDILRQLKSRNHSSYHLDILLRGSRVYIPPPPLKAEPVRLLKVFALGNMLMIIDLRIQGLNGASTPRRRVPRLRTDDQSSTASRSLFPAITHHVRRLCFFFHGRI